MIWRLPGLLRQARLCRRRLHEVNRQLDALGFVIKRGTLVDATILAGSVRRLHEGGEVIRATSRLKPTRKRDKTYFYSKAHLAVDEESACAPGRDDPANAHDSRLGEALIQGRRAGLRPRPGVGRTARLARDA